MRSLLFSAPIRICLVALFAVCAGCATQTADNALGRVVNLDALRNEALSLVNEARAAQGVPGLQMSGQLNAAAQDHAEDMARRDFYSHRSPERQDVADRFRARGGGPWWIIAENIAQCISCAPMAEQVRRFQQGWMNSPGHRRNILDPRVRSFGFGIATTGGKIYAVQTFVTERE